MSAESSQEQIDLFLRQSKTLSIQQFCEYATSQRWHDLENNSLYGVLLDFIIVGEPFLFNEHNK
jgi:hypothetical protein